jgi:endonuclease/exonuclease/phosphatase family metal-dependent hydrolase
VGNRPPDTLPTSLGRTEFAAMRLDYVLATEAAAGRARRCRVVRQGSAQTASDHYPLVAELDFALC